MALVRINLTAAGLREHGTGRSAVKALADHRQGHGPLVILIHGFKFAPDAGEHCPHTHILSFNDNHTCWKAKSWPKELGLDRHDTKTLGIAYGWPARGSIWQAYERAAEAGRGLARLIRTIRKIAPDRPIHILAHSLGARVALSALPHLPDQSLDRAVLLAGAEFTTTAEALMDTPAGRTTEIISITSRENRRYERLLERVLGKAERGRAIGLAPPERTNWVNLPLDEPHVLADLAEIGHVIAPPQRWFCHWSSYLRPGVFSLYSALVADTRPLPIAALRRITQRPEPIMTTRPLVKFWPWTVLPSFGHGRAAG